MQTKRIVLAKGSHLVEDREFKSDGTTEFSVSIDVYNNLLASGAIVIDYDKETDVVVEPVKEEKKETEKEIKDQLKEQYAKLAGRKAFNGWSSQKLIEEINKLTSQNE